MPLIKRYGASHELKTLDKNAAKNKRSSAAFTQIIRNFRFKVAMRKTILLPLLLISTMTQAAELFIFNDTLNSSWNVFQGEAVKDANGSIAGIGTYSCFSNLTFSKKDFEVITLAKTVRATEIHTQNTIVGSMVDLRRFKAREVYITERKSDKGLIIARAYFPKVDGVEQIAVISPWGRLECDDTNTPCGLRYGDFIHTTSGQYRVLE